MADWMKINPQTIRLRTGKTANHWKRVLDKFNAEKKGHALTARYLRERHNLSDWWAQVIIIRYVNEKGAAGKK